VHRCARRAACVSSARRADVGMDDIALACSGAPSTLQPAAPVGNAEVRLRTASSAAATSCRWCMSAGPVGGCLLLSTNKT
jgi:hypothetical protein